MTDRGAIESIAEELCGDPKYHGSEHIADAQRILDRLAADGWTVVKADALRELENAYALQQIRSGAVPTASEDDA